MCHRNPKAYGIVLRCFPNAEQSVKKQVNLIIENVPGRMCIMIKKTAENKECKINLSLCKKSSVGLFSGRKGLIYSH